MTENEKESDFLGVELYGDERRRYEEVRAARIRMEKTGIPSPYLSPTKSARRRPRLSQDGFTIAAAAFYDWLQYRETFSYDEAESALGYKKRSLRALYKVLYNKGLNLPIPRVGKRGRKSKYES